MRIVVETADEVREAHRDARLKDRERFEALSPVGRMEEAYRLFRLVHDPEEDAQA